jgi:TolB-like protein/Tfp pilus assembly protein PilF
MAVVLPFENLGPAEDAYFAAGVTEEITRRLASVSSLGVISRTSAENYSQSGKTIKQIGSDLGVDYVLEGSVRWAKTADGKGRVRIAPQLVRVSDDTPIWSDTFDREVTDIFEVQTEIANHVVDALGVTLQGGERESLGQELTSNLQAYELYLRAKTTTCNVYVRDCEEEITSHLERAVALDPRFLGAWYELSHHHSSLYHMNIDRTEARLARAKTALDRAVAIDPDDPFTQLARGYYYYYGFRDYDRALVEFQAAIAARPNDAEARFAASLIQRRKARWDESIREMEQAIALDPRNHFIIWDLADTYDIMRRPELAMATYERAYAVHSDNGLLVDMTLCTLRYFSDTKKARAVLARSTDTDDLGLRWGWASIYIEERNFSKAIETLEGLDTGSPSMEAQLSAYRAHLQLLRDGKAVARPALERSAVEGEAALRESPSNADNRMTLAIVYANLGRTGDAVSEAKVAIDLTGKDPMSAPQALEALAEVYAIIGRGDEAVDLLSQLLTMKYDNPITMVMLQRSPRWDALRKNAKFQALLKSAS